MPVISMFYGIIVRMFNFDNQKHHTPHIHVEYQNESAVVAIESGELLQGDLPPRAKRILFAWMEIHREELIADWRLAVNGEHPFKIRPLD
ncbi:MAG: DUF4160 domain-containing protein [Spirochaetes bacterium]|nr:MAG: DUF4160 domain-containing protein [Spirochaetota bacterium]